jgi:hypothetical protein
MNDINVTIVIVNWNSKDMLRDCLSSIIKHNNVDSIRIVVIDNDSSDSSAEMVKNSFPFVKIINSGGNIGFARANNIAIPHIETPFVLFLNPDTLVYDGTIDKMVQFMKNHNEVGAVSCKMKYLEGQSDKIGADGGAQTLALQWFPSPLTEFITILFLTDKNIQRFKKYLPYHDPNKSGYLNKLMGTCMMVRKKVMDDVGGFDERFFMYGEDADLSKRISDNGWKLYYMSEAEIVHLCGGTSNKSNKEFSIITMCESIQKLMGKYYGMPGKILYKLIVFIGSIFRICVLFVISIASRLFSRNKQSNSQESIKKYIIMLKWSLFNKNPQLSRR